MFVIVEQVIDEKPSNLPDRDLANIVHGEYTLLEAINEAEKLYKGYHENRIYIQEVSKEVAPKGTKRHKVVYMMINNYQSIAVYLLEEEEVTEKPLKNGVEINGDHIAFYKDGEKIAEVNDNKPADLSKVVEKGFLETEESND